MRKLMMISAALLVGASAAAAQQAAKIDPAMIDSQIKATFKKASPEWQARIEPDESQRVCSAVELKLTPEVEKKLIDAARRALFIPPTAMSSAIGKRASSWRNAAQAVSSATSRVGRSAVIATPATSCRRKS